METKTKTNEEILLLVEEVHDRKHIIGEVSAILTNAGDENAFKEGNKVYSLFLFFYSTLY